jgi:hypothetical protein
MWVRAHTAEPCRAGPGRSADCIHRLFPGCPICHTGIRPSGPADVLPVSLFIYLKQEENIVDIEHAMARSYVLSSDRTRAS